MSGRIHPSACVDPRAELGAGVVVGPGAIIGPDVRVGDGCEIGAHVLVTGWTTIGAGCRLHHGAVVGSAPQDLKYTGERSYLVIGDHTEIREYVTANLATEPEASTRVGSHTLLMAYAHVAHNCQIGDHVIVANATQMGGYVSLEDWAIVGGLTALHQFVRVGRHAIVGGGSRISQDVAPYMVAAGSPPRCTGINRVGLERRGFPPASRAALERAYRILFRNGLTVAAAVDRLRAEQGDSEEVGHLARFAETSARGLTR